MERFLGGKQTQHESVNEESLTRLRALFDEAISCSTAIERAEALEQIISDCAVPLEAGADLSPEYSNFLESLTKMHMLEVAHAKLEKLFQSAA